jgi:hypothetical protein
VKQEINTNLILKQTRCSFGFGGGGGRGGFGGRGFLKFDLESNIFFLLFFENYIQLFSMTQLFKLAYFFFIYWFLY